MKTITKEQEDFLNKCTNGNWELNPETGLVDVDGDFNCSDMGLSDFLGIEFGDIRENFSCSRNELVSLKGAPQEVSRNFYCVNNKLVFLEGAPKKVGKSFDCSRNKLTSLEGAQQEVKGSFDCSDNNLVSLEGAPQKVGWDFFCDPLPLRGCPSNLLKRIYFSIDISLSDLIRDIDDINGLAPEIYLKKMI